jgi:signal transduction histidine kinase
VRNSAPQATQRRRDALPIKVLHVEDDPENRLLVRAVLEAEGYTVVEARDGLAGVQAAIREQPALILLDINLPAVDGYEVVSILRSLPGLADIAVVAVTAYAIEGERQRTLVAGCNGYIEKPIDVDAFPHQVAEFLDGKRDRLPEREHTPYLRELYQRLVSRLLDRVEELQGAYQALHGSREELRALSSRLQAVRETERTRVAREIHDELGQRLTQLRMDVARLPHEVLDHTATLTEKARAMSATIDETIRAVRRIASELRPGVLDDLGLVAALQWQTQDFQMRTGIRCQFTSPGQPEQLDRDRSTAVFRILQEMLTNVARHAEASTVHVRLGIGHTSLVLEVRDNGKGIREAPSSDLRQLGILGMRERAGEFGGEVTIHSIPARGTTVTLSLPLTPPP